MAPLRAKLIQAHLHLGKARGGDTPIHWASFHRRGRGLYLSGSLVAVLQALRELPGTYRLRSTGRDGHILRVAVDCLEDRDGEEEGWTNVGRLRVVLGVPRDAVQGST